MDSSLSKSLINTKSPYLKTIANSFERNTQIEGNLGMPVIQEDIPKPLAVPVNNTSTTSSASSKFAYYSGLLAAAGQATAGLLMVSSALLMKQKNATVKALFKEQVKSLQTQKEKNELLKKLIKEHGKSPVKVFSDWAVKKGGFLKSIGEKLGKHTEENNSKTGLKLKKLGWRTLSSSWIISVPSCIGAALNAKQPSMVIGTLIWGIAAPFMWNERNQGIPAIIGSTPLGAAFVYAGMANKEKNDNELKKGEVPKVFNFKEINKNNWGQKSAEFAKYVISDIASLPAVGIKAISQSWNYVTGKRKEKPEYCTVNPTENNSKLASLLLLPGALFFMAFGKNEAKFEQFPKLKRAGDLLIGTGLLFEALYMLTLGNAQKGINKALILSGVPMRVVGDFSQSNPIMLGMRTLGGASFEYYFATLNKEEDKKKAEAAAKLKQQS
jgi:hypothetical protein